MKASAVPSRRTSSIPHGSARRERIDKVEDPKLEVRIPELTQSWQERVREGLERVRPPAPYLPVDIRPSNALHEIAACRERRS